MSANGNIINSDSGMANEASRFRNTTLGERYSQLWDTLDKTLNNTKVCHLLNFLVICMAHLLMNINFYYYYYYMLSWLKE